MLERHRAIEHMCAGFCGYQRLAALVECVSIWSAINEDKPFKVFCCKRTARTTPEQLPSVKGTHKHFAVRLISHAFAEWQNEAAE